MSWLIRYITEVILSVLVIAVVGVTTCKVKVTVTIILEDESNI